MQMTSEEIKRSYQTAADPKVQIEILADLNLCQKEDIRRILIEQGIPEEELPKKRGRKKKQEEPVVVSEPIKEQIQKEELVIPTVVRATLHGVIREKQNRIEQLLLDKNVIEEAIKTLQIDVQEMIQFLGEGDLDEKEQK